MKKFVVFALCFLLLALLEGCRSDASSNQSAKVEVEDSITRPNFDSIPIVECLEEPSVPEIKKIVPKFKVELREREDFDASTPRTRYYIRIPKAYSLSELDLIADSLRKRESQKYHISEIWVNYFLPKRKMKAVNSYALSARISCDNETTIFEETAPKKYGYNPPKARNLSGEDLRTRELWGAFDQGQIAGYKAGYKDGKRRREFYHSFNSSYPTYDEWVEQSYKQGYEVGYRSGYTDSGAEY